MSPSSMISKRGIVLNVRVMSPNGGQYVESDGLLDTGADVTSFEEELLEMLGYRPVADITILTATGTEERHLYDVRFMIDGHSPTFLLRVAGLSDLARYDKKRPFGLLGRDLLELGRLTYDGGQAQFKLDFEQVSRASTQTLRMHASPPRFTRNDHGGIIVASPRVLAVPRVLEVA